MGGIADHAVVIVRGSFSLTAIPAGDCDLRVDFFRGQAVNAVFPCVPLDSLEPFGSRRHGDGKDADLFTFRHQVAEQTFKGKPLVRREVFDAADQTDKRSWQKSRAPLRT
jgi:hypothetical protein